MWDTPPQPLARPREWDSVVCGVNTTYYTVGHRGVVWTTQDVVRTPHIAAEGGGAMGPGPEARSTLTGSKFKSPTRTYSLTYVT